MMHSRWQTTALIGVAVVLVIIWYWLQTPSPPLTATPAERAGTPPDVSPTANGNTRLQPDEVTATVRSPDPSPADQSGERAGNPFSETLALHHYFAVWKPQPDEMVGEIRFLLSQLEHDRNGTTTLRLARLTETCREIPLGSAALQQFQQQQASQAMAMGENNGTILERTDHSSELARACRQIREWIPAATDYRLWESAARLGHPRAQTELATRITPTDYEQWQEAKKQERRMQMGGMLLQARSACEYSAFLALSYPAGHGYGHTWQLPDMDDSKLARLSLANLHASIRFLQERFSGQAMMIRHQQEEVERRMSGLSAEQIVAARNSGEALYRESCGNTEVRFDQP